MSELYLVTRNARDKVQVVIAELEQCGNTFTIKRTTGQYMGKMTKQPEIIKGELAQVLSFQELIKFTAVMRSTCQSWGILHSEKRGELEDQARGFSRVAAAPYPCLLLAVSFFCRVAANALPDLRSVPLLA